MRRNRVRHGLLALLVVLVAVPAPAAAAEPAGTDPGPAPAVGPWAEGRVIVGYTSGATQGDRQRGPGRPSGERGQPLEGTSRRRARGDAASRSPRPMARLGRRRASATRSPTTSSAPSLTPDDPRLDEQWGLDQPSDIDIDAADRLGHDDGLGVDDRRGDRHRDPARPPGPRGQHLDEPRRDPGQRHRRRRQRLRRRRPRLGLRGRRQRALGRRTATGRMSRGRSRRSATTGSGSPASRIGSRSCPCGCWTRPDRASCPTRSARSATRRPTARASRTCRGRGAAAISQSLLDALEAAGGRGHGRSAPPPATTPRTSTVSRSTRRRTTCRTSLSVAAVARTARSPRSRTGASPSVDIAAPGDHILSTWPGGGYAYARRDVDGHARTSPASPRCSCRRIRPGRRAGPRPDPRHGPADRGASRASSGRAGC